MFRRIITETQITEIINNTSSSNSFVDITWAALVALPVANREMNYNITDGDPNNNNLIYGNVTLNTSKTTFYYNTSELILIN